MIKIFKIIFCCLLHANLYRTFVCFNVNLFTTFSVFKKLFGPLLTHLDISRDLWCQV